MYFVQAKHRHRKGLGNRALGPTDPQEATEHCSIECFINLTGRNKKSVQILVSVPSNFYVLEGNWLPLLVTGKSSYFVSKTSLLLRGFHTDLFI